MADVVNLVDFRAIQSPKLRILPEAYLTGDGNFQFAGTTISRGNTVTLDSTIIEVPRGTDDHNLRTLVAKLGAPEGTSAFLKNMVTPLNASNDAYEIMYLQFNED